VKVERVGTSVRVELDGEEAHLLRRALEKALFIDVPREEQSAIAVFSQKALDALGSAAT
jgi:hypothetical protein